MEEVIWVTVDDGMPVEFWADCIVPGCKNKRCAAIGASKCHPHSNGLDPKLMDELYNIMDGAVEVEMAESS